jgi:hypothetical protein
VAVGEDFGEVETQRAPAATIDCVNKQMNEKKETTLFEKENSPKIENLHPILQPSPLNIQLQHSDLRLRQRLATFGVQAARVLHARAQRLRQDARADFVVLLVGIGGVDGDGSLAEQVYVRHLRLESRLHRRC